MQLSVAAEEPAGADGGAENETSAELFKEVAADLATNLTKVASLKVKLEQLMLDRNKAVLDTRIAAADHVYGALFTNQRSSHDQIFKAQVNHYLELARDALPQPSTQAREDIANKLQLAVLATEESLKLYSQAIANDRAKVLALKEITVDLNKAIAEESAKTTEQETTLTAKREELISKEKADELIAGYIARENEIKEDLADSNKLLWYSAALMIAGIITLTAGIVGGLLYVPKILFPGVIAGLILLAGGYYLSILRDLLSNKWFNIAGVIVVLGLLAYAIWVFLSIRKKRKEVSLDDTISGNMIGATQELKNDDIRFETHHWDAIRDFVLEENKDPKGKVDAEIRKEVKRRLVALQLVNPSDDDIKLSVPTTIADVRNAG